MDKSRTNIMLYFLRNQFKYDSTNILQHGGNNDTNDDTYNEINNDNNNDNNDNNDTKIKKPKSSKYKWTTLSHNGLKFPEEYVQRNVPLIYDGKEIMLPKNSEEIAFLYANAHEQYTSNSTFNKNFFNDWKKVLNKDAKTYGIGNEIQSLNLCDFSKMKQYLENKKEQKKLNKVVNDNEKEDDKYKHVIVDGKVQDVSNYRMEPIGIFLGRGKNPNLGKIKKRIMPEDVIINIGKNDTIPIPKVENDPTSHKWKKVIHDRKVEWLASWKDTITGKTKYLQLSAHSDMKTNNDQQKFDIARKLKKKINSINETNQQNLQSSNAKTRQIATALFFIDKLAIRVGNEKAEDETDTVGVTSLRVEHILLGENNSVTLNFLGKDSVPYTNTINVDDVVYQNIKELINNKNEDDQVFDLITSNDVNKYLQEFMPKLTAKVYRTYNASNLFQKELRKVSKKYEGMENQQKAILDDFIKANAKVAKMMNHQKNISSGYKKSVDKINDNIDGLKKQLNTLMKSDKKNPDKIKKLKERIKNYKSKKEIVKEMKNISLGTSKANYIDPRITVAFLKTHNLDVNKLFTKALQEKFKWAFEAESDFKF